MSRGSSRAAPVGPRVVGGVLALAGIALLVIGLLALNGGGDGSPPVAAPTSSAPASTAPASSGSASSGSASSGSASSSATGSSPSATAAPTAEPTTVAPPPPSPPPATSPAGLARAPLTVLNNSTVAGLADRAAADAQRRGWSVAQVGNFAGRLPVSTAYYTPGDAASERAARQLAVEFPQVGQVLPRYAGLPPTPAGVVLVVTRDWS